MNKKYTSLVLAGLMCFSSVVPVFAYDLDSSSNSIENVEYQNTADENYNNATNVFAELGSEYKVTIPKTIVLSGVTKSAEYKVSVSGDIASYETIYVIPDETVNLYSKNKETRTGTITQDRISWTYSTINNIGNGLITTHLTAGKWSGVFDFDISFNRVLGDVIDPEHIHNAGDAQIENLVQPDCETPGSYDEVFYCIDCFSEISRESKIIPATGHNYKLIEKTDANCTLNSTEKYQCSTCFKEMETHNDIALGHKPNTAVRENEVASTCTKEGSYDEVIYCADCGEELERTTKTINKLAHKPTNAVRENEVASTCAKEGSYDEVIYCAVCGKEISRTTKTINKLAHKPASAVRENEVAITYTTNGSYDVVTYCASCGKELSRTKQTVDRFATGGLFDANNNLIKSWDKININGGNRLLSGKLIIPNSVTSIPYSAFQGSSLTKVTIPNSVTSIGRQAFGSCKSLGAIVYNGTKAQWNAIQKEKSWSFMSNMAINCTDGVITK